MADRPIKFLPNGEPDNRGRSKGSKASQFTSSDGRKRPGRPKGSPDERTLVLALLNMRIGPGKGAKRMVLREGIYRAHAQKALKGDSRSTDYIQKLSDRYEVQHTDADQTAKLLADDQFILESLAARGLVLPDVPPADEDGSG